MNKKGFTLVELLAVIIILSLLALIANSSVTNVISNSKSDLYNTQIKLIETAAQNWGVDNLNKLPESGACSYITLKDLKDYGMFEKEIINPKTNEEFSDDLIIKITSKTNDKGELVSNYEISPSNIKNCTYAYPKVCTLVNDADSSGTITAGDVYNCKVKEEMEAEYPNGYTFYVLTTPTKDTVDFIMNQSIYSDGTPGGINGISKVENPSKYNLVAWNNESGQQTTAYGPVTAMEFLYNATKNWTNISALNYEYQDEEYQGISTNDTHIGYKSFISSNGVATITSLSGSVTKIGTDSEPLRARMPIYSAVWNEDLTAKVSGSEKGEVADKKADNSNAYLYDNMSSSENNLQYGYWTLSSTDYQGNEEVAWVVDFEYAIYPCDVYAEDIVGVRPVITLTKRLISN